MVEENDDITHNVQIGDVVVNKSGTQGCWKWSGNL